MIVKKLHIYIFKEFIWIFIASLLVTLFIFDMQFLWLYISDFVGKGLSFSVFMKMMLYAAEVNIFMALPIALMLSSIIVYGNLGEHFELTAMKSSGISLFKIISPLMIFSIIMTGVDFWSSNYLVPYANFKLYNLLHDIRQKHPALNIEEGIFNYDIENYVIKIDKKDPNSNMMYNFLIYDHEHYPNNTFVLVADSGKILITADFQYLLLELYNGAQYIEMEEKETDFTKRQFPHHQDFFTKQTVLIPLSGFELKESNLNFYKKNYKVLNVAELKEKIDSLKKDYKDRLNFKAKILLLNELLTGQIKLRTRSDTAHYKEKLDVLNNIPPNELKVILNFDSLYKEMDLTEKKELYRAALNYAKNIDLKLKIYAQELDAKKTYLAVHQITLHQKFVYAIACLIFFFIGAPLGSIIRKGGIGLPTVISTILFIVFYVLMMFGERTVKEGILPAYIGIWLAIFIYLPIEIFIFYKAFTDSVILNYDVYIQAIQKFFAKILPNFLKPEKYRKIRKRMKKIKKKKRDLNL